MYAKGHYAAGTDGCQGTAALGCQFATAAAAQSFCNAHQDCTAIVLHPSSSDAWAGCADQQGGICYSAVNGELSYQAFAGSTWACTAAS